MLDLLLYALFIGTMLVTVRWLVGVLAQALVALFSAFVSLTGTVIVVGALFFLLLQIVR
jgi:hypothetical protein